jgi:hypothetical protein
MTPHKRPRFGPSEIFILIVIGVIGLIVITHNHQIIIDRLYGKLYSGTSALIAVVMLVEYLLLKGADRSPIYLRELEAARQRRRDDLLALREMETQLVELRSRLAAVSSGPAAASPDRAPELSARLEDARRVVESVLDDLRERI